MNGIAIPTTNSLHLPSTVCPCNVLRVKGLCLEEIPPNALLRKGNSSWRGGFSLGVDLGMSRTGLALSKGFSIRPLKVLELRGQKLELQLLDIAEQQEVDEFIIGLPKSVDGKETPQSNKVRSVAGRFAARAAERGWRVYLQDEHGTSAEAMDLMLDIVDASVSVFRRTLSFKKSANLYIPKHLELEKMKHGGIVPKIGTYAYTDARIISNFVRGLTKGARQEKIDAYAAMMVLERYFSLSGHGIELVLPKQLELQEKLRRGPPRDVDFFPEDGDILLPELNVG